MSTYQTRVLVLQADNWEALYLDGECVTQHHQIEEGEDRGLWFMEFAENNKLTFQDFTFEWAINKDAENVYMDGSFPDKLKDLTEDYFNIQEDEDY